MTESAGQVEMRRLAAEIVRRYGPAIVDDPRRCEALLRDLGNSHKRELFLLVTALREGAPASLRSMPAHMPKEVALGQLVRRLHDDLGLVEELARWAVETWALALGIITTPSRATPPPRPPVTSGPPPVITPSAQPPVVTTPPSATPPPVSRPKTGAAPPPARPTSVFIVNPHDRRRHPTINAAIQSAKPHTLIKVQPGVYRESVVIDRPVEIVGDGPLEHILVESVGAPCLQMETYQAVVRGLTLTHKNSLWSGRAAVDLRRGSLILEECVVSAGASPCVQVTGPAATPTLRGCKLHGSRSDGVHVDEGGQVTLEGCEIYENGVGVRVARGAAYLKQCRVHHNRSCGVWVDAHGAGRIEGCDLRNNVEEAWYIAEAAEERVVRRRNKV